MAARLPGWAVSWGCFLGGVGLIGVAYAMSPAFTGLPILLAVVGAVVATASVLMRNTTVVRDSLEVE